MIVLKVESQKAPERIGISGDLEFMQEIVGGSIQAIYPFDEPIALICNEEGKLDGLPLNRSLRDEDGKMLQEEEGSDFDANFAKYQTEVTRFDAVEIAVEVEEAQRAEAELAIQARKQAFQEKKDSHKEKLQARRAELAAEFEDLKKDIKELREL